MIGFGSSYSRTSEGSVLCPSWWKVFDRPTDPRVIDYFLKVKFAILRVFFHL